MSSGSENSSEPREKWARLYADESSDSYEAENLLRKSGYRVITFSGTFTEPELVLGRQRYRGLKEIRALVAGED